MRSRIVILVVAVLLGILAAFFAARYLSSARADIRAQAEPVSVLVADRDLPAGMSAEEIIDKKYAKATEVPRQYVSDGAVSSAASIEGQVLVTPLSRGEQLTVSRFQLATDAGLAYSIPPGFVAVSVPDDPSRGVSGFVKPGDYVMVIASFQPGGGLEKAVTQTLLNKARVIATGTDTSQTVPADTSTESGGGGLIGRTSQGGGQGSNVKTLTLAVSPADAERIVFAQESGSVWYALIGATSTEVPPTAGQSYPAVIQ